MLPQGKPRRKAGFAFAVKRRESLNKRDLAIDKLARTSTMYVAAQKVKYSAPLIKRK
jgi:hypothetical protein